MAECWRNSPEWNDASLAELKNYIETFKPPVVGEVRILFLGPVGAGKSSFFNTVSSVVRGYVTSQACSGSAEQSITSKYRIYPLRGSANVKPLNVRLCDTMGLEETHGINAEELSYLLEGNVPDGYNFNPTTPISPGIAGYISSPKLKDKIHCICFVIDGSTASVLPEKMTERIKALQARVRQKGIPMILLLTKVDKVCPDVERDLTQIFKSQKIKDLVDNVSQIFGIPRSQVMPTKNYEKEVDVNTNTSMLALISLRQMLRATEDFLFNFIESVADNVD